MRLCLIIALVGVFSFGIAQEPGPEAPAGPGGPPRGRSQPQTGPRSYADVVTKDAVTEKGVFNIHRIGDRVLLEIPANMLGREFLVSTEVAELPAGMGYGGQSGNERVIRFIRRNNKIFMRNVDYSIRATGGGAIEEAVKASSIEPVLAAWDVEAEGDAKSVVVDVTRYFTSDPTEFSVRGQLGGGSPDANRSYIDRASAYPDNVVIRSFMTFAGGGGGGAALGGGRGPGGGGARPNNPANSALVHFSIVLLPEKPMMGRLADSRVGYFSRGFQVYGHPDHKVVEQSYITRHRLEKKNPNDALSDPVKPIIYYVSREVPEKWRPYVKKGIEDWQPAFEKAGFRNAIIAKDAPTKEEDPKWDPEDVRYSVIRWAPTPTENAMGPNVHDPRSGEILSAHIIVWHNILKLVEAWYFVQASPMDPRAQKIPFPDDLMGELLRYVIAHEVGHTLGLQHNFKASSAYTVQQLRSPSFTNENGNEASIMDYGRFNYVAQPGDNARLIPLVGPYDKFAIEWGYKPIPGAATAEAEKGELDKIAARQLTHPELRFGGGGSDPTSQSEDLGSDPVEAGKLGMANIARVMGYIVKATSRFGEDYDTLRDLYGRLWGQRSQELRHALALVGGSVETNTHAGRGGANYAPVTKTRQQAAIKFLQDYAFDTPKVMIPNEVLLLIEPSGAMDRVIGSQRGLLSSLLQEARIRRMMDQEVMLGNAAYSVRQMVTDIQNGLFRELDQSAPLVDPYRRNLQRAWLEIVNSRLNPEPTPPPTQGQGGFPQAGGGPEGATASELRPVLIASLDSLNQKLTNSIPKAKDPVQQAHIIDLMKRIETILNPKD